MKKIKKASKGANNKAVKKTLPKKRSSGRSALSHFELIENDIIIISGVSFLVLILSFFLFFR